MDDLYLAISSVLGWGWNVLSINIPVLGIPFWTIAVAAIAADLAFWILSSLIGSGVSVGSMGTLTEQKFGKNRWDTVYSWRGHTYARERGTGSVRHIYGKRK